LLSAEETPRQGAGFSTRIPILYLAPWVDYGGSDKNTLDWFREIDRERFAPSLITTQPSPNRRLAEIADLTEETWVLPDLMPAERMPAFILDFIVSRKIEVVQIMNSRLGFDLLPDVAAQPSPPGVVVMLHVEEADCSGYVRYVTTRYGNLVDRFSVTSRHLAAAVEDYGIPSDRIKVTYTGVDAEREFSPDVVEPVGGLDGDRFQILFPARIVQQKDPLTMVEVARGLVDREVDFQIHALGEGELQEAVRSRIREYSLEERVILHPPTPTPQSWMAACDAVLLTSEFEGVPVAVFESMAMGLPVVTSALPGTAELLGDEYEGLVEPRDSVERYVDALARLAEDETYRSSQGDQLRARALAKFTLQQMAEEQMELYEDVVEERGKTEAEAEPPAPVPLRFLDRPLHSEPLVSILVPHYNQPQMLAECIDSIWAQTYPNIELILVDDCSTTDGTAAQLEELEKRDEALAIRLDRNGGPSRARNIGLEHCAGRYVLPVDADNLLLPEAVERLVEQISTAGEEIGFIYPNLQFFGNREDYFEPGDFNLYKLLQANYCDTCSLIDREVFDAGLRYREEILLGHEDWEFILRLAAHGVRGERSRFPTLGYRKWGFNRSDAVEHAETPFEHVLAAFSPFAGKEEQVKAEGAPALSIVALRPLETDRETRDLLAARLERQSCNDFELIMPFDGEWAELSPVPQVVRIPSGLVDRPFDALRHARTVMRGGFVLASQDPELDILGDAGFVEKVLRRFTLPAGAPDAIAFVDAGEDARFRFRNLAAEEFDPAAAHAIVWRVEAEEDLPSGLWVDGEEPAGSIARQLSGNGKQIEWRHSPCRHRPGASGHSFEPAPPRGSRAAGDLASQPLIPGAGKYRVPRWEQAPSWIPSLSTLLVRYRDQFSERRFVSIRQPPSGYVLERVLGAPRIASFQGTKRLVRSGEEFATFSRGEWEPVRDGDEELGYLEHAPLPQFQPLALGVHRDTGQQVLVTLSGDPLLGQVESPRFLGFIEPFPIEPGYEAPEPPPLGLLGLVKTVDYASRRHRYAIGRKPDGELLGELGSLAESELQGSVPAWIVDGQLVTDTHTPPVGRPGARRAGRWTAEPAVWGGIATRRSRVKTALRRSTVSLKNLVGPLPRPATPEDAPDGWLFDSYRPGLTTLYTAYHPVTRDQLLTRSPEDAAHMGYGDPELIGFVRLKAQVTGSLAHQPLPVPWARRFGAVPRSG
jgi:glycosyltransferase involved in cell wall biosynthesis